MWNNENDSKLLEMVNEIQKRKAEPNWHKIALEFKAPFQSVIKRYKHLIQPFTFTYEEENLLVDLATRYFDDKKEVDWEAIGKQLRNKPGKECEKKYYKIMQQYWDEETTKLLIQMADDYKAKQEKVDWEKISQKLSGRPVKVLQDWYSIQKDKNTKKQE